MYAETVHATIGSIVVTEGLYLRDRLRNLLFAFVLYWSSFEKVLICSRDMNRFRDWGSLVLHGDQVLGKVVIRHVQGFDKTF